MRKAFGRIDDLLLERVFQPISDFVAHRIGLNRPSASCFCLNVASFALIVSRASGLSDAVAAWDPNPAVLDLAVMVLGLIALVSLRALFRQAGNKPVNPLRPAMQPHRAIVLLLLAARVLQLQTPNLAVAADLLMLMSAVSALYLGACADLPPVRRRLTAGNDVLASPA